MCQKEVDKSVLQEKNYTSSENHTQILTCFDLVVQWLFSLKFPVLKCFHYLLCLPIIGTCYIPGRKGTLIAAVLGELLLLRVG